jgi:hypothetical protein
MVRNGKFRSKKTLATLTPLSPFILPGRSLVVSQGDHADIPIFLPDTSVLVVMDHTNPCLCAVVGKHRPANTIKITSRRLPTVSGVGGLKGGTESASRGGQLKRAGRGHERPGPRHSLASRPKRMYLVVPPNPCMHGPGRDACRTTPRGALRIGSAVCETLSPVRCAVG